MMIPSKISLFFITLSIGACQLAQAVRLWPNEVNSINAAEDSEGIVRQIMDTANKNTPRQMIRGERLDHHKWARVLQGLRKNKDLIRSIGKEYKTISDDILSLHFELGVHVHEELEEIRQALTSNVLKRVQQLDGTAAHLPGTPSQSQSHRPSSISPLNENVRAEINQNPEEDNNGLDATKDVGILQKWDDLQAKIDESILYPQGGSYRYYQFHDGKMNAIKIILQLGDFIHRWELVPSEIFLKINTFKQKNVTFGTLP
ncbi:hypothetical protein PtB15_6B193 [Puccinia triticina]|nr:hypothetical protein PtB15_6B193 [Puccinia triticina]